MRSHFGAQSRRRTATVGGPHDSSERLPADPVTTALVADDVAPPARARRFAAAVASVYDRSGPGDDHDAGRVAGAGDERDERVVHHEHARFVADAPHDRADGPLFVP